MSKTAFLKQFITEEVYIIDKQYEATQLTENKIETVKEPEAEYVDKKILEKEIVTKTEVTVNYKGANKKGIAIIVNYTDQEFINSEDEAFLLKILSAVKLTAEDVAIINIAKNENLNDLEELESPTCLIFDLDSHLTEGLKPYNIIEKNKIAMLWSSPLSTIAKDKAQKKLLWEALQALFLK